MDTSKLTPNDPRVRELSAQVRGKTYTYILGEPKHTAVIDTIFLIHGFPDSSFGWRYQVPYLMSLGFRVVVPNMLGYAGTSRPDDLESFSTKSMSADLVEFAAQIVGPNRPIILGGHDWGGVLVWRINLWHPDCVKAVFSICTPFFPPASKGGPFIDQIASGKFPNFAYQLQFVGPDVEDRLQTKEQVRQFINGVVRTGGLEHDGFTTAKGVLLDNLPTLGPSGVLSEEEVDYYTEQFMQQPSPPLRGGLNWYRASKINYDEELALTWEKIEAPALFVAATRDTALLPSLSAGMEKHFTQLTRAEVDCTHWALTEAHAEVNAHLGRWLREVLGDARKSQL